MQAELSQTREGTKETIVKSNLSRRRFLQYALAIPTGASILSILDACGGLAPSIPEVPAFALPPHQKDLVVFIKQHGQKDPVFIADYQESFSAAQQFLKRETYGKIGVDFNIHPDWIISSAAFNDNTSNERMLAIGTATLQQRSIATEGYTTVIFITDTGGTTFGATLPSTPNQIHLRLAAFEQVGRESLTLEHELIHSLGLSHHDGFIHPKKLDDYSNTLLPAYGASLMGGPGGMQLPGFLSGVDRVALGCITPDRIQTVTQTGKNIFTISELQDLNVPGYKILRIPIYNPQTGYSNFYYVEYRADRVQQGDGGVEIRRWDERLSDNDYQATIDHTNAQGGIDIQVVMNEGNRFHDKSTGISIKQVKQTTTDVTLEVTVPAHS